MNITLEPLYKKTKTGAIQVCKISTDDETMIVEFGQLDGKMQIKTTICTPKNVGKANETTKEDQAVLEAKAKHASKIKGGYSTELDGSSEVKLPMKVKVYQDQKNNVVLPCYISPKLNGVNGEFRLENEELKLYSRGGNEYPMIEHLKDDIISYLESIDENSVNVELYKHGWFLEDITAAVKKYKPESHDFPTNKIEAHIFDIPENDEIYRRRIEIIYGTTNNSKHIKIVDKHIKIVDIAIATSHKEIEDYHIKYEKAGYEGIIIRNPEGLYKYNERSSNVFKYKKTKDSEFQVFDYSFDKNNHTVFKCYSNNNKDKEESFKVKLKGTNEQRLEMSKNAGTYINKWLKVEYETISKYGNPLKPVGLHFRDCDENGNPLE